jgi:septal ring factor EnvC (AmiA/AmiB activator)
MKKLFGIHCGKRLGLFLLAFSIWLYILMDQAFSDSLGVESKDQTEKLTKIRIEMEDKRKSMELLHQKEMNAYEELLDLEERLDLTRRFMKQLRVKEKKLETEQKIKEKSLGETDTQLIQYREQTKLRLTEIYKHHRLNSVTVIFGTSSPVDLLRRFILARMVLKRDRDNLERIQNIKEALEEKERNLKESRAELAQLEKRKTGEEIIYSRDLQEKNRLLKQIRSEKNTYAQVVSELEKNATELENVLAGIQSRNSAGPVGAAERQDKIGSNTGEGFFIIAKGKLPWPIQGRVVSRFGEQINPQFQTKIRNTGIEIESASGEEVVAVSEGRVIYSSGLRGYGNMVILEHDDGYYTLYARLSEIWVSLNQNVDRLQTIGTVGEIGLSFKPTLHFEIREGKQPQNPLEWLR